MATVNTFLFMNIKFSINSLQKNGELCEDPNSISQRAFVITHSSIKYG